MRWGLCYNVVVRRVWLRVTRSAEGVVLAFLARWRTSAVLKSLNHDLEQSGPQTYVLIAISSSTPVGLVSRPAHQSIVLTCVSAIESHAYHPFTWWSHPATLKLCHSRSSRRTSRSLYLSSLLTNHILDKISNRDNMMRAMERKVIDTSKMIRLSKTSRVGTQHVSQRRSCYLGCWPRERATESQREFKRDSPLLAGLDVRSISVDSDACRWGVLLSTLGHRKYAE